MLVNELILCVWCLIFKRWHFSIFASRWKTSYIVFASEGTRRCVKSYIGFDILTQFAPILVRISTESIIKLLLENYRCTTNIYIIQCILYIHQSLNGFCCVFICLKINVMRWHTINSWQYLSTYKSHTHTRNKDSKHATTSIAFIKNHYLFVTYK